MRTFILTQTYEFMKNDKKAGVFMDHSHARFIQIENNSLSEHTVVKRVMDESPNRSTIRPADQLNAKEKEIQKKFYHDVAHQIKEFQEVLLFGPTQAKTELLHLLRDDKNFTGIKIQTANSDKLTEKQQIAFVKDHFGV